MVASLLQLSSVPPREGSLARWYRAPVVSLTCAAFAATLSATARAEAQGSTNTTLRVTYLANMGVQLTHGGTTVVIDALHRGALRGYAPLLPATQRALEEGRAPFERIAVALVTHRHLDHFDPAAALARLSSDSTMVLVAPIEVIDTLVARNTSLRGNRRLRGVRGGERIDLPGVSVTVLDLPHSRTRTVGAQHVGYAIDLGGFRVLHVGDANPDAEAYTTQQVRSHGARAAIVPVWYLMEPDARLIEAIGARCYLASHIGPDDTLQVVRRLKDARVPARALASRGATLDLRDARATGCS